MPGTNRLCHYRYDPLDLLASVTPLAKAIARHFYKGGILATTLQGTEQRTFMRAQTSLLAQLDPSGNVMLATDRNNSVLQANTKQAQTPVAYSAYGHRQDILTLPGLPGFNGEKADQVTGHYLLGNGYRAYNPVLMRFNSPDSLSPFGKGGLNAYAYCLGNPVKMVDPTGHFGGLSKVLADLMVTGIGKGVGALKATGNRFAGSFAKGLSGKGASRAGKHFAPSKTRAGEVIVAESFKQKVSEFASIKAREAVLRAFSSTSVLRQQGRLPALETMGIFDNSLTSLIKQHPKLQKAGGDILGTPFGIQAIADFDEHAMKYLTKGGPMESIDSFRGGFRDSVSRNFNRGGWSHTAAIRDHLEKARSVRRAPNPLPMK